MAVTTADKNQQHFATDHLLGNLRGRTAASAVITFASQGVKFGLTLASTVLLARLLSASDFGLVAMAGTATAFLRVFKDAGLSAATVQREGITHAQVSNLFWLNTSLSAAMALIMIALSPIAVWFYKDPRLLGVMVVLSCTFLLSGLSVQHSALLNRQMRFKALAIAEVTSFTAGVLVAILMAIWNCGYWSLVGMAISQELMYAIAMWNVCKWRPQVPKRGMGTRSLVHFGANLTAANFIYCLSRNLDTLLIGRLFGADSVGMYTRAMALLIQPVNQLLGPISKVFQPTLARLQSDPDRYRRTFLQVYNAIALSGFVGTAILLPLSRPITEALLGPRWGHAAEIFAGFTGLAIFFPLSSALGWLLTSQGRGHDSFVVSAVSTSIVVCGIIGGVSFGPLGVAVGWSVSGLVGAMPYLYYKIGRSGPVTTKNLWSGFLTHLPVWIATFSATYAVYLLLRNAGTATQLCCAVPSGLLAATIAIYINPSSRGTAYSLCRLGSDLRLTRKQAHAVTRL